MNGEGAVFFFFYFPHCIFDIFFLSFYFFSFYFILFLAAINLLMFVLVRKDCYKFLTSVLVFKFEGCLGLIPL